MRRKYFTTPLRLSFVLLILLLNVDTTYATAAHSARYRASAQALPASCPSPHELSHECHSQKSAGSPLTAGDGSATPVGILDRVVFSTRAQVAPSTLAPTFASVTPREPTESVTAFDRTIACTRWKTREFYERASASNVSDCLAQGSDPQFSDADGNTPLHWAASLSSDPAVVQALAHAGGHLHARNRHGLQPLHVAAAHNEIARVLTRLVKAGADPHALTDDGRSSLHLAAQYNTNPEVIDDLLSFGLDLSVRDKNSKTAIDYATQRADTGVLEALVRGSRALFSPAFFDVTPFRDENRVFLNTLGAVAPGKPPEQFTDSPRGLCQYEEYLMYFPADYYSHLGECEITDGVKAGQPPVLLEAQFAGDVALGGHSRARALAFSVEQRPPGGKRHVAWQYYATMVLRLRMMRTTSVPILPPSFMPKVTFQRLSFKKDTATTATMRAANVVVFGHHSNGQTGCPFVGQVRRKDDGECLEIPSGTPTGGVNVITGNFSTHYSEFSHYWRRIDITSNGVESRSLGVGIQQHWPCIEGADEFSRPIFGRFGTMCHIDESYGKTRLWVESLSERQGHALRFRGNGNASDRASDLDRGGVCEVLSR